MKLTNNQVKAIENCNNNYLKVLYITDFMFNKERTKDGFYATLKESNKTSSINAKMFYLYLTCKFNLNRRFPFLEDTMDCIALSSEEEKEVDNLDFIDIYSYKNKDYEEESNDNVKTGRIKEIIKSMRRN